MWGLTFISRHDFLKHVQLTIQQYGENLVAYDLRRLNSNIVDPIKLIFDKFIYGYSWEEIIKNEVFRQRDKSNNNSIGYFHQRIFQYVSGCVVPSSGWDVIYTKDGGITLPEGDKVSKVFVEIKNKHNTMNSASAGKTYMRMQGQLLSNDDCACLLVEVIAKNSQNVAWSVSVDGTKQRHRRIRRVSMDEFYKLVTGQEDAFYKMCMVLPSVIQEVISDSDAVTIPNDNVFAELKKIAENENGSIAMALYMLGFGTYIGFGK